MSVASLITAVMLRIAIIKLEATLAFASNNIRVMATFALVRADKDV